MTDLNGDRSMRSVAVVVAAAGRGERFGGSKPKALEEIAGVSLLEYCLEVLGQLPELGAVVVAAPQTHVDEVTAICSRHGAQPVVVVPGGPVRAESVANAIAVLPRDVEVILVHDAARAFTPVEQFRAVIEAVQGGAAAVIPGSPVVDTVKEVDESGYVVRTVPRETLRSVQTPQGFDRATLVAVHSKPELADVTDDAGMVEADGGRVLMVPGHADAFKVTTPFDRLVAHAVVERRNGAN